MTSRTSSRVRSFRVWLVSLLGLAAVVAGSLAAPPGSRASAKSSSTSERLEIEIPALWQAPLRDAAIEFGVPRDLLVVLGHLESRWRAPADSAEGADSHGGGLGLNERSQQGVGKEGSSLRDAARLLGTDLEALRSDPLTMVRGAAAVLRAYRDDSPDAAAPEDDLESWAGAVRRFASYSHPAIATDHVEALYVALERLGHEVDFARLGLDGELAPVALVNPLGCEAYQHAPRPPVDLAQSAYPLNYETTPPNLPRFVVLHSAADSFWGLMERFARIPNEHFHQAAHYTVAEDGRLGMSVCENHVAFHVDPVSSRGSIAVMHESFGAPTDAQYETSARLVGVIARQWGLSPDEQSIWGAGGWLEPGNEPGVDWDWQHYYALVDNYFHRPAGPQQPCAVQCGQTCVSPSGSDSRFERMSLSLGGSVRGELTLLGASDPGLRSMLEAVVGEHQSFFDSQMGANPQLIGAAEIAAADGVLQELQGRGSAELAAYLGDLRDRLPDAAGRTLLDGLDAVLRPDGGEEGGAPRSPDDLQAIPVPGAENEVELRWLDRSWNEEGFRVLRRRASGNWQEIGVTDPDDAYFEDEVPDLPGPGGVLYYFYKVVAFNGSGSAESNRAELRMYAEPPGRPDTLRPRGCIDTRFPTLSWNGHGRASRFYVRLLDLATNEPAIPDALPSVNRLNVNRPLREGVAHMLRVWGMNNMGFGEGSDPEYFLPFCSEYEPPRITRPLPGCIDTLTPTVEWTPVDGAIAYHLRIHRVTDIQNDPEVIAGGVGLEGTSWTIPPGILSAGTTYRVKVKPNTGGVDIYSPMRFFTPHCSASTLGVAAPLAPSGGVSPTSQPEYAFEPASGADGYTLEVWTPTWQRVVEHFVDAAVACDEAICRTRPADRLPDGSYHWRLAARRGTTTGIWGPWASFSVVDEPIGVGISDDVANENGSGEPAVLTLELSRPSEFEVRVGYTTAADSATSPADFSFASGTVVFPPGATRREIRVEIANDGSYELGEQFFVRLRDPLGALIDDPEARIAVHDDDPQPRLVVDDVSVDEGGAGALAEAVLRIRLEGATEVPAAVVARTAACTATAEEDYLESPPRIVSFDVGQSEALVEVPVVGDAAFEGDDLFLLELAESSNATIADASGQGRIRNDDPRGPGDPPRLRARTDFDGDGRGDLLWRNSTSGRLSIWYLDGSFRGGGALIESASFPAASWTVAATGDFDRDGDVDLLWRNAISGRLALWTLTGAVHDGGEIVDGLPVAEWDLEGSADFDRDGSPDLLWRNRTSGALRAWLLDRLVLRAEVPLSPAAQPDPNWEIAAIGDLDADDRDDLLWRHRVSGALVVWYMDGLTRRSGGYLEPPALADFGWQPVGIWDVDDDGANDLVWHHVQSRRVVVWYLDGATRRCGAPLVPEVAVDPGWSLVAPL